MRAEIRGETRFAKSNEDEFPVPEVPEQRNRRRDLEARHSSPTVTGNGFPRTADGKSTGKTRGFICSTDGKETRTDFTCIFLSTGYEKLASH